MTKNYLSLYMNFKNEEKYLKEWLDFHIDVGVEHFYLINNKSDDKSLDVLQEYIDNKKVTLFESDRNPVKPFGYEFVLKNYGNNTRWLGFIDCDEFIMPTTSNDLKEVLEEFEKYPALGINTKMFGSSWHKESPQTPVLESYFRRQSDTHESKNQYHVKSIVDPSRTIHQYVNPHYFYYKSSNRENDLAVNENHQPFSGPTTKELSFKKLCLHHYYTKSKEDFIKNKCGRPRDDNGRQRPTPKETFDRIESSLNEIEDKMALEILKRIRRKK